MGALTGPGLGKFTCGDLATCSISDLGTADAGDITSGTFGLARIPVMDDAHIPNLETLSYGGTFAEAQIPDLPTTKITEGTFGVARIPVLPTERYGSAVLVSGARAMEGTLNIDSHVIDNARRYMFGGGHEVSLRSMGTYELYIESKDALHWSNVWMGDLAANKAAFYGTINVQGHPITGVVAPTLGSHAANKSYVDAQGGGIGTHGNEYHDPNMLPTAGGTHTGTLWMSNGALKDMMYIRSPSSNSLALSYGLSSKLTIESDKVQIWDDLISAYDNQDKLGDSTHRWKEFHAMGIDAYGTINAHDHEIDDVKKIGFRDIHDVALITEGTYSISVVNKAESLWGIIETGHLYTHAGFAWYIEDKVAGEDLISAHLGYLKSDSKWWETDADAEATTKGLLGLIMQTKSTGQAVRVLVLGRATFTGWGLTVGATQYVSCTKGLITETAPSGSGDQVRKIGHALSATTIIFNPDSTILELV